MLSRKIQNLFYIENLFLDVFNFGDCQCTQSVPSRINDKIKLNIMLDIKHKNLFRQRKYILELFRFIENV
jgi:hypothetical protein